MTATAAVTPELSNWCASVPVLSSQPAFGAATSTHSLPSSPCETSRVCLMVSSQVPIAKV